jgi:hypothetical protein
MKLSMWLQEKREGTRKRVVKDEAGSALETRAIRFWISVHRDITLLVD